MFSTSASKQVEKARLDEENYRLQKENEGLRQRISKLRNDNFYLENKAREELNLVRPGKIIYRFAPSEPKKNRRGNISGDPAESRPSTAQKTTPLIASIICLPSTFLLELILRLSILPQRHNQSARLHALTPKGSGIFGAAAVTKTTSKGHVPPNQRNRRPP